MNGSVFQRCGCPTLKDDSSKLVLDEDGKALKAHRVGCKPSYAFAHDGGRDASGKRKQVTRSGFKTKREAQAACRKSITSFLESGVQESNRITVATYLDQWLQGKVRLRPSTRDSYEGHIRLYLKPALGHVRLADLRHFQVEQLFVSLRRRATEGASPSPATIKLIHATLHSALNSAVKRRLVGFNAASFVELERVPKAKLEVWEPGELAWFLIAVKDDELGALYYLIAFTGLRRGEALGLRWKNVDFLAGAVTVEKQRVQVRYKVVEGEPKTEAGHRTIPLNPETVAILREHHAAQSEVRHSLGQELEPDDLVFLRADGTPWPPEYVTRRFAKLSAKAGLSSIRLHDVRHTHATHALVAGVPLKVVQERLGHASFLLTANTYSHVLPSFAAEAAEQIANLTLNAVPCVSRTLAERSSADSAGPQ